MKTSTIHCGSFSRHFDYSEQALEKALSSLPDASFQRSVLRYQNRNHQWISLLSRQLLIQGFIKLGVHFGKTTKWSVTDNGRPYIQNFPDFNISHSGEIAICAIGLDDERVGIDIQKEKPIKDRHLQQVMTNRELAWVAGSQDRAAKLWSRKEAVSKLLGLGMRVNFRSIETLSDSVQFEGKVYHLVNVPTPVGYQCTLAGEKPLVISLHNYCWSSLNQLDEKLSPRLVSG